MVGRGPFEGFGPDEDIDPTSNPAFIDLSEDDWGLDEDEGERVRSDIYNQELEDPGFKRPNNPTEGSIVSWNIRNSPVSSLFSSLANNFSGDPTQVVRGAARSFDQKFAELELQTQQSSINNFVQVQASRLRSVTSSFDELSRSPSHNATSPTGFLRSPSAPTYYGLLAGEQGQSMGLRMTYYQMQQRDVMQAVLNRNSSVDILAQGYEVKSTLSAEDVASQQVQMSIALGNVVTKSAFESGQAGSRKSYSLVNLDKGAFHPKMGYIAEDIMTGTFAQADAATPQVALFGTQNITGALKSRTSSEELLVFNRDVVAHAPVLKEIRAATDALLETQRLAQKKQLIGSSFRDKAQEVYQEITGKRNLYMNRRFIEMNQDVQLRMQSILKEAAQSNKRVVLSVQYLENLFRESTEDASVYGDFQRSMRGTLETLARGGRLRVSMQAGRLGNRAGLFSAMDDLLKGDRQDSGASLLRTLLDTDSIDFAPSNFMHSKSFAVFSEDNKLSAFGMMSANLSRFAAEHNIETGLFIEDKDKTSAELLASLNADMEISNHYLNVMSRGFSSGAIGRKVGYASELKSKGRFVELAAQALSPLERSLGGSVSISKRYRLPIKGETAEPADLLSGLDISLQGDGYRHGFSVSIGSEFSPSGEMPVVYLNESSRAVVGGVYTNRSRYKVNVGGRVVSPGETIRLDAIEMLQGLVTTMHRGIEFESRIRAVNDAYSKSFGGDKVAALQRLNSVLAKTFMKATSMVTGAGFEIGEGNLEVYDVLKSVNSAYGEKIYAQVVEKTKSLLERFGDTHAEGLSESLKMRLTPERSRGVDKLFSIFKGDLPSRSVISSALVGFESTVSDIKFGGQAFADIRRRVVDESSEASSIYRQQKASASRDLIKALSSNFFAPHELGYSASQALANLPTFAITDDIIHSLDREAIREEKIDLLGAILNPDLVQHGMSLGRKGSFVRGIASIARTNNYDIYSSLGGILKAEGGAARVHETESLFRMMPGLEIIRGDSFLSELEGLAGSDYILKRKLKDLRDEIFSVNERTLEGLSQPSVRESLLLLPYSKTEQISQRLKNLSSTRPALDISDETLNFISNLGIGSKRSSYDMLFGAESLSGSVKSALPEHQFQALKQYASTLDRSLTEEQRESAILRKFRGDAVDPTALTRGVIGGETPRRVLHNLGISTMSDFGYLNAGYDKSYGYGHRVSVRFDPRSIGSGADLGETISKIEKALGRGVIASVNEIPLGEQAISVLQEQYRSSTSSYEEEGISPSEANRRAAKDLSSRFSNLNIRVGEEGLQAALKPGMYRLGQGSDPNDLLHPERVGTFDEGSVSFTLSGVEKFEFGRRTPIKVRLPAFSRREYEGITAFTGNVSTNVESGRVTLQADTINMMKFRSGLRPGEAAAKGPLTAIDKDFFEEFDRVSKLKSYAGGVTQSELLPERVRNEQIFAMLPRSAVKGFNYESGLALLEDVHGSGLMKLVSSDQGGEAIAQALGVLLIGNKEIRESLASSVGQRSPLLEAAVRGMNKAPKALKDIDYSLLGGSSQSGAKRLGAVAAGIYTLADVREGETLHESLERTIRGALETGPVSHSYTQRALDLQGVLKQRTLELFNAVRSDQHSIQIGSRLAFEEKGPTVKAAALLAYLTSTTQQMFGSPNGSFQYGTRPLIELNLDPNYRPERQQLSPDYTNAVQLVDKKLASGTSLLTLRDEIVQYRDIASKAAESARSFMSTSRRGYALSLDTHRQNLSAAANAFGVDVDLLSTSRSLDNTQLYKARLQAKKILDVELMSKQLEVAVMSTNMSNLERFVTDKDYRDKVRALGLGLGVQLPEESVLRNIKSLSKDRQDELKQELEFKLQHMYSIFQTNRPIETLMELSPSKSLVAAGMKEVVNLEYQYTTALTEQALSQYVIDTRTKDSVRDLQSAVLVISEAMNPSTRRTSPTELRESALNFRMINLLSAERDYGPYGRALIATSQIVDSYNPVSADPLVRLGKNTSVVEDLLEIYKQTGDIKDEGVLSLYRDTNAAATLDIGARPSDELARVDLLSKIEGLGIQKFDPTLGSRTWDEKKAYISDFYSTLRRRKDVEIIGGQDSLARFDIQLKKERPDYYIALNRFGTDIERTVSAEGTIDTKEALFNLFERNKVWDVMKEQRLEDTRATITNFYNRFDEAEDSQRTFSADYKPRSVIEALGQETVLQEMLRRNPVVNLFLKDSDSKLFRSTEVDDGLIRTQKELIESRLSSYQERVLKAVRKGLSQDVGDSYISGLEAVRSAAISKLSSKSLTSDQRRNLSAIKEATERTEYLTMPSFSMVEEAEGRMLLRLNTREAPTTGIRLGLDVLQRMSFVFPDYTSDILLNQRRMEELRRKAHPILKRFNEGSQARLNADEVDVLKELRETMHRSTQDLQELSTTDTVRQMLGDRMTARGATFVPTSSFLIGSSEVGAGSRLRAVEKHTEEGAPTGVAQFLKSEYETIRILTAGDRRAATERLAGVLNKFSRESKFTVDSLEGLMKQQKGDAFVNSDRFVRRVVNELTDYRSTKEGYQKALSTVEDKFYLGTVLVNRGGAPAMIATSTAGTPLDIVTTDQLIKRAEYESTYIKMDPKMGSTALMISAVGHQFSELGDYDGDMFQTVLTDIARVTSEISNSNQELVLLSQRLGERFVTEQEKAFLLSQRGEILGRIGKLHTYLKEKLEIQDSLRTQTQDAGRYGVRSMVSAYTGLPSELFGEDRPISDLRSMTLIQQYRDTQSGLFDNAVHVAAGNEVIEAMSKAKYLRINKGQIEGLDLDSVGASQQAKDLIRTFVQQAVATGRLQEGETNPQRIVKEFSTVQGSIANLQASLTNLNKGLENFQGQVMSANVFESVQGAVGFAGSSLLGKTYNTIIPLMYSVGQEISIQRALSREGPQGAFKEQLIQNLRSIGASEHAIRAAQNIAVGAEATALGSNSMKQINQVIGFMGTMQQMMRDALKPKGDGGIGDQMVQFNLESKLQQSLDDQERVGVMREFVLSQIGSSIDLPSADSNKFRAEDRQRYMQATSFGLMHTLSEYVSAESMDSLMGYSSEGGKPSVFAKDLRTAYERYKEDYASNKVDGRLMDKEDFTASLLSKLISRAQANFVASNVMADAPDTIGLVQGIERFYSIKRSQLNDKLRDASTDAERAQINKELQISSKYLAALAPESDGERIENRISRFVYTNLTEGGAGINERHIKYMREFGQMHRDLLMNKDLSSAIAKNLEVGLVAVNSMIQRGKAEPETIGGMMAIIQEEISSRGASSMPELDGLSEGERASVLYERSYMRALDPSSMFPGLEDLPAAERNRARDEIIRAMTMPTAEPLDPTRLASADGEVSLSNGMETSLLNRFLKPQISAYEKALGLSSKFQALKQEERLAMQQNNFDLAERLGREAEVVQQQIETTREANFSPSIEADVNTSNRVSNEASNNIRADIQKASIALKDILAPDIKAYRQKQTDEIQARVDQTTSEVESTYGRARKRNEMAEIAGLLAGPLIFGASQGAVKLDERAALFGLDVIQSVSQLAQYNDSVVSTKLVGTKAGENYHDSMHKRAREAALAFRYQRITSAMRSGESSIGGAIQGVAMESMYQLLNVGAGKAAAAVEKRVGTLSQTALGKGSLAVATEVLGGVAALSASRTLFGKGVGPREEGLSNEIENILRHYSIQAYEQAERAFLQRMQDSTVTAEDAATGEDISTDIESDGAPSEFEQGIEMGLIAYDNEDSHMLEIDYFDNEAPDYDSRQSYMEY